MLGYQAAYDGSTYTDEFITMYQTASGGAATTANTAMVSGTLKGKQRNVFGSYLVYNSALNQIQFDKFTSAGFTATYTSPVEAAVQYLGSHEYYWWGWGTKLLAKASDGVSFRLLQVRSDFDTIAGQASPADLDKIMQEQTLLFQMPFHTIVPPVFVQDVAVFFYVA